MSNKWWLFLVFLSVFGVGLSQLPPDKKTHLYAGIMIGSAGTFYTIEEKPLKSFAWAMTPTVIIGGSKELIYDKWMGKGTPEWKDFGWTCIGGVAGYGIVRGFKWTVEGIARRVERNRHYDKIE